MKNILLIFAMAFISSYMNTVLGSEDYEAYRQSVIQSIVEKTGDRYDHDYYDEVHDNLVPGTTKENKIAVESALQSIFDEHEGFLQTLFARQTDPEFLPYIQKYEDIKGDALRSDIKIFFSDNLLRTIAGEDQEQDTPTELEEWQIELEEIFRREQIERERQRQRDQQIIGSNYNETVEGSGFCLLGHLVFIDSDVWQILSEIEKGFYLFHEIGHCDLYRVHSGFIMDVSLMNWFFAIMRNPNLTLQRNSNYKYEDIENQNPMCLCNEFGECSNNYCLLVDDNDLNTSYNQSVQAIIDIAKSGNFEPLYQELFSKRPQYYINFQVEFLLNSDYRVIREIAKEPRFQ